MKFQIVLGIISQSTDAVYSLQGVMFETDKYVGRRTLTFCLILKSEKEVSDYPRLAGR
jgi:hypothetical protein